MKTVLFERLRTTVDEERASLQKVQAIIAKEQRVFVVSESFVISAYSCAHTV